VEKRKTRGNGSIYQRKDKLWVAAYVTPSGKKIFRYAHSEAAVKAKLRELKADPTLQTPKERNKPASRTVSRIGWL